MPTPQNRRVSVHADERLSQLIKLKRLERPDPGFWVEFEHGFRSKQLSSLVSVQPLHSRVRHLLWVAARKAAPPSLAIGAITVTVFAVTNSSYFASDSSREASEGKVAEMTTPEPTIPSRFVAASDDDRAAPQEGRSYFEMAEQKPFLLMTNDRQPLDVYQMLSAPVSFSKFEQNSEQLLNRTDAELQAGNSEQKF